MHCRKGRKFHLARVPKYRGGYGPTVGGPVAMGYVNLEPAQPGKAVNFLVRGQVLAAKVARLAFVEHRYFRG